jgi:IMP dehydrogenase
MKKIIDTGLTFDDLLLLPAYSKILPTEVNVKTRITKNISLNIPILSAAMDTVTDARLAIAIAREGGMGIIHKNLSIEEQVNEVTKVKRSEYAVIKDPITLAPDAKVEDAVRIMNDKGISSFPIVKGNKLVGIITHRDLRFLTRLDDSIADHMTKDHLVTAPEGTTLEKAKGMLQTHKVEKLLLVNDQMELRGLITIKDITKTTQFPLSCKDSFGRLRVGAAVGVTEDEKERAFHLKKANVDLLVVDTAHGHTQSVFDMIQYLKTTFPEVDVMAGNIGTAEGCQFLIDAGADAVKVGIGPGSICTTRVVAGVGIPQLSAIMYAVEVADKHKIPIIADGGIRYSGDIPKAIAAGASAVMIGNLFAGTLESPGEIIHFQGKTYKAYRGMGSISAMKEGGKARYQQQHVEEVGKLVPEGIEGRVPYKGTLGEYVYQLIGGLKSGMGYCGCEDIPALREHAQFIQITSAAYQESHPHDIFITKEAPNYGLNR